MQKGLPAERPTGRAFRVMGVFVKLEKNLQRNAGSDSDVPGYGLADAPAAITTSLHFLISFFTNELSVAGDR